MNLFKTFKRQGIIESILWFLILSLVIIVTLILVAGYDVSINYLLIQVAIDLFLILMFSIILSGLLNDDKFLRNLWRDIQKDIKVKGRKLESPEVTFDKIREYIDANGENEIILADYEFSSLTLRDLVDCKLKLVRCDFDLKYENQIYYGATLSNISFASALVNVTIENYEIRKLAFKKDVYELKLVDCRLYGLNFDAINLTQCSIKNGQHFGTISFFHCTLSYSEIIVETIYEQGSNEEVPSENLSEFLQKRKSEYKGKDWSETILFNSKTKFEKVVLTLDIFLSYYEYFTRNTLKIHNIYLYSNRIKFTYSG